MNRFKKGDRIKFKQNDQHDWEDGTVEDITTIDHNPTYVVNAPNSSPTRVYVMDIAPVQIKLA